MTGRLFRVTLVCLGLAVSWVGIQLLAIPAGGKAFAVLESTLSTCGVLLSVLGWLAMIPLLLVMLFVKRSRRSLGVIVLGYVALVAFSAASSALTRRLRDDALRSAAARMEPLVNGVARYEREHGAPPDSLEQLVPVYLARLPGTGLGFAPELAYERLDSAATKCRVLRYDVGPGRCQCCRTWIVLDVNARDGILTARLEGLPDTIRQVPFDTSRWRVDTLARVTMAEAVRARLGTLSSAREAEALLGAPTDSMSWPVPRWALRARLITGLTLFDGASELAYTPDGAMPLAMSVRGKAYGGWTLYSEGD